MNPWLSHVPFSVVEPPLSTWFTLFDAAEQQVWAAFGRRR